MGGKATRLEPQWQVALTKANAIRVAASNIRRQMKRGELSLGDALEEWTIQNYPLERVVSWQKRIGSYRAGEMLRRAGFMGKRRQTPICKLSPAEKAAIDREATEWENQRARRK